MVGSDSLSFSDSAFFRRAIHFPALFNCTCNGPDSGIQHLGNDIGVLANIISYSTYEVYCPRQIGSDVFLILTFSSSAVRKFRNVYLL